MHVVLWDSRKPTVAKDLAGGMGAATAARGVGLRGRIVRRLGARGRRPVALLFAHLAAIFRRLGHTVEYVRGRTNVAADLYVFNPSLMTLDAERSAIRRVLKSNRAARVFVVGTVASTLPEAFAGLDVTVVKGEAEQLLWKLDDVLQRPGATVQLGTIEQLDSLPLPDWFPFQPWRFRVSRDFWRFPTALLQHARGCPTDGGYCPSTVLDGGVRLRDPEAVVDEILHGMRQWDFHSFKFCDPVFGLNREHVYRLATMIGRLPRKIQFSIDTRLDVVRPEMLRLLKRVGLTCVAVDLEPLAQRDPKRYDRAARAEDRQRTFFDTCRRLGIRTVAGFVVGFADDTQETIDSALSLAMELGPTFVDLRVATPYPGTEFFAEVKDRIADEDLTHYDGRTPVLECEHLSRRQVAASIAGGSRRYHLRWPYLKQNTHLLLPRLQRLGMGQTGTVVEHADAAHPSPPRPKSGPTRLQGRRILRTDRAHRRSTTGNRSSRRATDDNG